MGPLLFLALVLRLGFSATESDASGFFFDERIPLRNIASILDGDGLRPQNYWYQSLSYLPQAALLAGLEQGWRATGWEALKVRDAQGFRPLAYRLCRATTVVFGLLTLWLTFRLGQRLVSARVGLVASLVLALLPWHIFTSARFKPDSLLLLLTLLTFHWILDCEAKPGLGRALRAGLGLGLTAATKLNGGLIAIPLGVLAIASARRPRAWLELAAAGATAAVVYLGLNPWPADTLATLQQNREYYSAAAQQTGSERLDVLTRGLTTLFEPQFHGVPLGIVGLVGFAVMLATALGWRGSTWQTAGRRAKLQAWLVLSFPVGQTVLNALATERFKENHLVQLTPFTSLWVALGLFHGIDWARHHTPTRLRLDRLVAGLAVVLVALAGGRAILSVRDAVVPTTFDAAMASLENRWRAEESRLLCRESTAPRTASDAARDHGLTVSHIADLRSLSAEQLAACDVLLFAADRLTSEQPEPYRALVANTGERRIDRFEAGWQLRGDDLVLLRADWRPAGARQALPFGPSGQVAGLTTTLPPCFDPRLWRRLALRVPIQRLDQASPEATLEGTPLAWHWVGRRKPGHLFVSDRVPCSHGSTLEITLDHPLPPGATLHLWDRPWRRGPAPNPG